MQFRNAEIRKKVGKMLRAWRLRARLTQWELAKGMGYGTAQFVSNWERGVSQPPLNMLPVLGAHLGVPALEIADLLFDAEEETLSAARKHWTAALRRTDGAPRRRKGQELHA